MSELLNLLPRDKHDFDKVRQLKSIDKNERIQLIPHLLEWLQDMNWPIAREVAEVLLTVSVETVPFVREVLTGEDDIWKDACLRYIVMELPLFCRRELQADLERIAYHPTRGEQLEEVHFTAQDILQK